MNSAQHHHHTVSNLNFCPKIWILETNLTVELEFKISKKINEFRILSLGKSFDKIDFSDKK